MPNRKYNKTHRQQLGMPDRWRLLERLDPTVMVLIQERDETSERGGIWKRLGFARKSQIDELRKEYGDDLEVL